MKTQEQLEQELALAQQQQAQMSAQMADPMGANIDAAIQATATGY